MRETRKYSFDLLKIISMCMVVMLHLTEKGQFINETSLVGVSAWLLYAFSTVAVNCFVLITGYYMHEKKFSFYRVLNIWTEVVFYSALTFFICGIVFHTGFSKSALIRCFLPFSFKSYWFVNQYILLLFISPILNASIANMQKKIIAMRFLL